MVVSKQTINNKLKPKVFDSFSSVCFEQIKYLMEAEIFKVIKEKLQELVNPSQYYLVYYTIFIFILSY